MQKHLHTYPVMEAVKKDDECPFCSLERDVFRHTMDFVLGSAEGSYMQRAVRNETDRLGFCAEHMKAMYQYGNMLGNALMMQTYTEKLMDEFRREAAAFTPKKRGLFTKGGDGPSPVRWLRKRQETCYICEQVRTNMERYLATFCVLTKDAAFRADVEKSKGFCMPHYAALMETAETELPGGQTEWFYFTVNRLMEENMARVAGDLDWFVQKFDYRNQDADWKNSRDAVSRMMQKLAGIYPADPVYKAK